MCGTECCSGEKMRIRYLRLVLLTGVLLVALTGCRGRGSTPSPVGTAPTDITPAALPAVESAALIEPDRGGVVALNDGAQVTFPPQALSAAQTVTLKAVGEPPSVPIPRSLIGRAYELALDGGELTGVALLKLPLPPEVTAGPYDVTPYRWNGKTWERITGRIISDGVQFGTNLPGMYALQGQWNLADATLALDQSETSPGQQTVPLAVTGQYRYSALPVTQDEYVQAHLTLKQDTSGGAGRVSGDHSLDKTIDEAQLLFKPDAAKAQGVIDFSHVFELAPGSLALAPGSTTRFYVVLEVADSVAPTRRSSPGIEYTQMLPIQALDGAIVRPGLVNEGERSLRWHVRLNGETLLLERAADTKLPLDPILLQGGLGEYRFTLEAQEDNNWIPVSNDVTVLLTLPPTATPLPGTVEPSSGSQIAVTTPTPDATTETSSGRPPTPTRRPMPGGFSSATATPTPSSVAGEPSPTATPTRPPGASPFWADRNSLKSDECTNLHWAVENVVEVYLNNDPVTGKESRKVCPTQTTTYTLRVVSSTGTQNYPVTIIIGTGDEPSIEFTADAYQIAKGECTTLRWRVTDVRAVYLDNQGVPGEYSQQVCPEANTTYELRVEDADGADGATTTKRLTISVVPADTVPMRFWADQYTLKTGDCTTLRWDVQKVSDVFLDGLGVPGVSSKQVCPSGTPFYTLSVTDNSGQVTKRVLTLIGTTPDLSAAEVIAQGIVNDVAREQDIDTTQDGDQGGYTLVIGGINPLFTGTQGWLKDEVTLTVPNSLISQDQAGPVDWPVNSTQQVEFRAACDGAKCYLMQSPGSYLRLRSE
jgi:hypothetical protein